jgi:hypothetical protein
MGCDEIEGRILDYLENRLPPAARPGLEAHLAGCADCQALARQLRRLDVPLVSSLRSPTLSPDFETRLRQRLKAAESDLSGAELGERQQALQAEFEAAMAGLRRKAHWALTLLDGLGYGVLAAVTAWLLLPLVPALAESGGALRAAGPATSLLVSSAASALFVLVGLGVAFQQPLRRTWAGR